jgi:hypothetical protein
MSYKWLVLLLAMSMAAGLMLISGACGDDDDDDDDNDDATDDDDDVADDDDDVVDDDDDVIDDDDDDDDTTACPADAVGGIATDFKSDAPVPNATIELVDNATGLSFDPAISGTPSGPSGYVELTAPAGATAVAVKFTGSSYKNTYQYNFPVGECDETFLGISKTTVTLIAALLSLPLDPAKGHASGAVYYDDGTKGDVPVGCAEVDFTPASNGEIRYFSDSDLPSQTQPNTNPLNGFFVAINADPVVAPGYEMTATASDGVTTKSAILPAVFADAVCIQTIVFDSDPGGCPVD